ncbi:hypothetical protein R1flu_028088 [Riccia fluitans]|uniref:Uncharacterized protein n=1 Tax=Riccia fluitans TaxID=41844 RepID=A0ABD1XKN8_9MARC
MEKGVDLRQQLRCQGGTEVWTALIRREPVLRCHGSILAPHTLANSAKQAFNPDPDSKSRRSSVRLWTNRNRGNLRIDPLVEIRISYHIQQISVPDSRVELNDRNDGLRMEC